MPYSSPAEFYGLKTFITSGLIGLLFVCGIIFIIYAIKKAEAATEKRILVCYGSFEILYAFTRIFFLFSDYHRAYSFGVETPIHLFYVTLAYSVSTAMLIPMFYVLEKYLVHTRYIFTGISAIIFIVSTLSLFGIITQKESQIIIYLLAPLLIICILCLYLYVIKITEGSTKQKAIGVFIGLLILTAGFALDIGALDYIFSGIINQIRLASSPSLMIVGMLIFTWSQLKE